MDFWDFWDACRERNLKCMQKYVQKEGASLKQRFSNGRTPLLLACAGFNSLSLFDLVAWILDHEDGRATLNWACINGWTPLMRVA